MSKIFQERAILRGLENRLVRVVLVDRGIEKKCPPNCLRNGPRVPRHLPRDSRSQHTKAAVWSAHCSLFAWRCNMADTNQYINGSLRNRRIVFPSRDASWNRNLVHSRYENGRLHPALVAAPGEGALPRRPEAAYHRRLRWLSTGTGPGCGRSNCRSSHANSA